MLKSRKTDLIRPLPLLLSLALFATACSQAETDEGEPAPPAVRVSVVEVQPRTVEEIERSLGTLRARMDATVAAEVEGRIVEIRVAEGDEVGEGDTLAVLDPLDFELELSRARAEVGQLLAEIEAKESEVDRQRRLRERDHVPQAVLEQSESELQVLEHRLVLARAAMASAQLNRDRSTVAAPFVGRVDARLVGEGEYMSNGQAMFRVVRTDALEVQLPFPERVAERLEPGQRVRLYGSGSGEEAAVEGEIAAVRPTVGEDSRAVIALVELANPGGWRPGGSVHAEVILQERESGVLPGQAVVLRPGGPVVFVEREGRVAETPVEIGRRTADWIEVVSGLEPGSRVVVDGAGFLADGVAVEAELRDDPLAEAEGLPPPGEDDAPAEAAGGEGDDDGDDGEEGERS